MLAEPKSKQELLDSLASQLKTNVVTFRYLKKDNTTRNAIGTLDPRLLPAVAPKTPSDKPAKAQPTGQFRYFDLEANAWRGFAEAGIIEISQAVDTATHIKESLIQKTV